MRLAAGLGAIAIAAALGARPSAAGMPHNSLPPAAISVWSLHMNAALLDHLESGALREYLFDNDTWQAPLATPFAADLVQYIASCALDPSDVLKVPDVPVLATVRQRFPDGFRGELGLCGAVFNASVAGLVQPESSWRSSAPTTSCLERVSACVLARVNQIGKRVMISMRGDGLDLRSQVPVDTTFREHGGTPIVSFGACAVPALPQDASRRNCEWEPRLVGRCVHAPEPANVPPRAPAPVIQTVTLALPPGVHGRIRVCTGIHGCDDPVPAAGPTTFTTPPPYGGELIEQGLDEVTFRCPDNGPLEGTQRTGYYSVMVGAAPGHALPPGTDVTATSPTTSAFDVYPAPEAQVFTYREGAFYGDLFKSALGPDDDVFAGDQHVCHSAIWKLGAAMASDRYCAGQPGCFVNAPMHCDPYVPSTSSTSYVLGVGTFAIPTTLEVYGVCTAGPVVWARPATTYLNHPCDLFPNAGACVPYLRTDVAMRL